MLHITNGDSAGGILRHAGIPGVVTIWADVLHEGPAVGGLSASEWRELRARYVANEGYIDYERALRTSAAWDAGVESSAEHEEVVLWFEHDLFDQLILVRLLDWFAEARPQHLRLTLICIDRHPAVERFLGLGQLNAAQLAGLFPSREPVTAAQFDVARRAWSAFLAPDPRRLERLIEADTSPLPFLAAALRRQLQEFPSVEHGLSRTEQEAMRLIARSPITLHDLFREEQQLEEAPFMGDMAFYRAVTRLAEGSHPLVEVQPRVPLREVGTSVVSATEEGRAVVAGRLDRVRLNGLDRWLGGVHLQGREAAWRWDQAAARLVGPS